MVAFDTAAVAFAGAALLGLATIPQAVLLLRHRRVTELGWTFTTFNFLGLALLAVRSLAIQEWAFLAINLLTTTFWGLVVVIKAQQLIRGRSARPSALQAASSGLRMADPQE